MDTLTRSVDHSLAFAGTVLGMLTFGVLFDKIGRKFGMIFASCWLAMFSVCRPVLMETKEVWMGLQLKLKVDPVSQRSEY
ncbi:hypothetical protein A4X03_0g8220 [Tilletia caries]|uniref:Major facilitator superfamily (MFS) profile domain-containing protein n=1 Tax=Tilletia caries TaxID=13290 RepID=A0A8T8SJ89_9BASI|nr:hypothetical protein A4X03_0g8220 [Tilletia caries]